MDSDDGYDLYEDEEEADEGSENDQIDFDLTENPSSTDRQAVEATNDFSFLCLTPETIAKTMIESIGEVNGIFQIPATAARQLLVHFNWDKERLLERYFGGDQEKLFAQAHMVNPHKKQCLPKLSSVSETGFCQICLSSVDTEEFAGVECGHQFCCGCWQTYLTVKICDEGMCQNISCPAQDCDILVDEVTVYRLLRDPIVIKKYQHFLACSYIEEISLRFSSLLSCSNVLPSFLQANRLMQFCPSPGCENAIKVSSSDLKPVNCLCGHSFCFGCLDRVHEPVKCQFLKKWKKKCDDESETSNWISANTKECPKCHATIEKGGGCNHMICRNRSCKFEFCWICQGPWQPHGSSWFNCNRYEQKDAKAARSIQAKSRLSLERYLFYYNRYANHSHSAKLEQGLYESVKRKMEEIQQQGLTWIEVQFLLKAVDVLCMCRDMLMFSYVFAFYLMKNNQSLIFEENQKDLEMATETLSGYLERESITLDAMVEVKQKVQDKIRYCQQRRDVLLEHVYEGYEKDLWEYNDS